MRLVGLALLALVLAAAAPRPMAWIETQHPNPQPVEQQGDIDNPTPCIWDVDDRKDGIFSGVIWPGETVVHVECVILDHHRHLVGQKVTDGLAGSIRIGEPAGATIGGATFAERCLLTPEYGVPEYLSLPAIGEGHGDRVPVTWAVTNVSGHRLGKATAFTTIQLATGQAIASWGC